MCSTNLILITEASNKGLCKENKFQKSEITMEVGGWVGPGLTRNFVLFLENHPKIALNQYSETSL